MGAADQTGCLRTCHLSELYLDTSEVPYHANCKRSIHHRASTSLGSALLTCRIHEVVSIPIHVNQLDSIGN
ncbi:hypothetical protein TNCV_1486971 [Trichonephila clavipes]|nr:hypothetical protein TNCV_1486971 [Trichonephila clavipes]